MPKCYKVWYGVLAQVVRTDIAVFSLALGPSTIHHYVRDEDIKKKKEKTEKQRGKENLLVHFIIIASKNANFDIMILWRRAYLD